MNFGCEADEKAVLDDADDVIELLGEVHCRDQAVEMRSPGCSGRHR